MPDSRFGDGTNGAGAPHQLAEDALRLVSTVQDWAQGWAERNLADTANGPHVASDCQWCPLCQFVAVLRGERPEVTERITEAGTALLAAVRAMAEAAAGGPAGGSSNGEPAAPRVQKINLGDEA